MEKQTSNVVEVSLEPKDAKDTDVVHLIFKFDSGELKLNLMSDSQIEMQNFFIKLLEKIKDRQCTFKFTDKNEQNIYNVAAEEYIKTLNEDIISIFDNYPQEISDEEDK